MKSHLKVFGHPVHPIVIVFPLGLLLTSVVFDGLAVLTKKPDQARTADKMIAAGVLSGLVAAAAGVIDWLAIPADTRAKRVGAWHGGGNVLMLSLFTLSWKMRRENPDHPPKAALGLSLAAMMLGNATSWLGGELVYRLGVGIDPNAGLDAPNSLLKD